MGMSLGICGVKITRGITPPLGASPSVGADGTQGSAYAGQTFTASGGNGSYTWSATGLPPGLAINSGTGAVTGTPTASGAYNAAVTVTDTNGRSGSAPARFVVLPSFSFSNTLGAANDTLTLGYAGSSLTVPRPVVTAWSFTATKFVATNGSDANNGTSAGTPWQTLAHAAANVVAGDVVQIAAGTYTEQLKLTTSGTVGSPIVWTIANGASVGSVILKLPQSLAESGGGNGVGVGVPNVWVSDASYNTLNGLVFEGYLGRPWNVPAVEHFFAANVAIRGASSGKGTNNTVQNCVGYMAYHAGVKVMDSGSGVCTTNVIRGNVWLGGGTSGTDHGAYVTADSNTTDGNIAAGWPGWGVHSYNGHEDSTSPNAQTVTNNLTVLGTGTGGGGVLLASHGGTVTGNTSYGDATGLQYFRAGCSANAVNHNICANSTVTDCGVDQSGGGSSPANNTDANNTYFPGGVAAYINGSNGNTATSDLSSDPMLLSPPADCRLGGNSPSYGQGCYGSNWTLSMTPGSGTVTLNGTNGQAFSQTFTASGGTAPYTYSLLYGTLPTGLSLVGATGVLSGTPSVSGTFRVAIKAVDSSATPKTVVNVYDIVLSPVLYVLDTFTGTDGTLLTAHTADINQGSGWTAAVGTSLQITGNAAVQSSGGARMVIDGAHGDGRALVDFSFTGSLSQNFLAFRYASNNEMWNLGINAGSPQWVLNKTTGGSTTTIASGSFTFVAGNTYTLEARFSGSTIDVYINGTRLGGTTDSTNSTATKCGMTSGGTAPKFDNFKISAYT